MYIYLLWYLNIFAHPFIELYVFNSVDDTVRKFFWRDLQADLQNTHMFDTVI